MTRSIGSRMTATRRTMKSSSEAHNVLSPSFPAERSEAERQEREGKGIQMPAQSKKWIPSPPSTTGLGHLPR
jgi:hypothetical protein